MKQATVFVVALMAVLAVSLFVCGCTESPSAGTPTPVPTTAPVQPTITSTPKPTEVVPMKVFNETDNGSEVNITKDSEFSIRLEENPTTGFQWNATLSSGLTLLSDDYRVNEHPQGMVGVGGIHSWNIRAAGTGVQTFSAIYARSWENVTGNETAFSMTFRVE
jgi:inhibitor of cysteine peptidase